MDEFDNNLFEIQNKVEGVKNELSLLQESLSEKRNLLENSEEIKLDIYIKRIESLELTVQSQNRALIIALNKLDKSLSYYKEWSFIQLATPFVLALLLILTMYIAVTLTP